MSRFSRTMFFAGIIFVLILSGVPTASAQEKTGLNQTTSHEVTYHHNNETAVVTTQILVSSDRENNYWKFSWTLPSDAEVRSANDTYGKINFTTNEDTLSIETNKGPRRFNELITLQYTLSDVIIERKQSVDIVRLNLNSLRGESQGKITIKRAQLLNAVVRSDHLLNINEQAFEIQGEDTVSTVFVVSDELPTQESVYYNFYGSMESNLEKADEMYKLTSVLTGVNPNFNSLPVVIVPDEEYYGNKYTSTDTLATYYRGVIRLPESSFDDIPNAHVSLAHETTHAFNDRLSFGLPEWFEEGTAKIIENKAKSQVGIPQPEAFGEPFKSKRPCPENPLEKCKYQYFPIGDFDSLWTYNQENSRWMKNWSTSRNRDNNAFGYAYSELVVRKHLDTPERNGLSATYNILQTDQFRITPKNNTEYALEVLELNQLTVCQHPSKYETRECVNNLNEQKINIPNSSTVSNQSWNLETSEIKYESPEPEEESNLLFDILRMILESIAKLF